MRFIITATLLFLTWTMSGQAQIQPDSMEGSVWVVVEGRGQARFDMGTEAAAVRDTVMRLASEYAVRSVSIRTGASPDGKSTDNQEISDRRAKAARRMVKDWLPSLPDARIDVSSVGEDYATLAALLRNSDIPGAAEAIHIIETVPYWVTREGRVVSSRKKQLMELRGGQTWLQMREAFFSRLRQTHIVIYFGEGPEQTANEPIPVYFPLDDATVRPSFRTNKESLARLDALFDGRVPVPGDTVIVVGQASMDGPEPHNAALSRRRAEALKAYVSSHYPLFSGVLDIRAEGEPWPDLRADVAADSLLGAGSRSALLGIIDSDAPADRKETRLNAVPGWRTHARSLYPRYRVSYITPTYTMPFLPDETDLGFAGLDDAGFPAVELLPDRFTVPALARRVGLRPVLGISTNLLYDITYVPGYGLTSIPSFSLEYYPARSRHFTFGLDLEWPMWKHWDTHRFLQINNIALWARRYFPAREDRFRGFYLQAGANAARFGIGWDARGWEGEGVGASLGLGHKWLLGRSRLFIDCGAALGVFYAQHDPYVYGNDATRRYYYDYAGDPDQFRKRNQRLLWAGPTRIYLSFGIDLFNRRHR